MFDRAACKSVVPVTTPEHDSHNMDPELSPTSSFITAKNAGVPPCQQNIG